ncbi:CRISPR-associated endonuclease Cas3'' [Streptomyces sp. NPDC051956]|uniref:CRISPR-associated endonuclease Cas3'' n=1 Tax=Streptomyces sp. NPDC051956 TaxID=3365677 RepID=UPI0037D43C12
MSALEDGRYDGVDVSPWGKWDAWTSTGYSLLFHLIDVGAVAAELWDQFLTGSQRAVITAGLGLEPEQARGVVAFLAALHDIGKLSPHFQRRVPAAWLRVSDELLSDAGRVAEVDHARVSMHAALGLLAEVGFTLSGNDSPAVRAAQCLGGHHGRFLQLDIDQGASAGRVAAVLGGPRWQELRSRYARLLWHQFASGKAPERMSVPAAVLITGLTMVADRLASRDAYWLRNAHASAFGAHEHYTLARQQAREAVGECGLARIVLPPRAFTAVHQGVEEPNEAQAAVLKQIPQAVAERGVGIVAVTDATGTGKSVTALELARIFNERSCTQGVAWLLPSTAAANGIYETLDRYVRAHSVESGRVELVHSHSLVSAAYTDRDLARGDASVLGGSRDLAPSTGEVCVEGDGEDAEPAKPAAGADAAPRGGDAALLTQFTVTTVDQAQMAALPVRYSALRLLALSGKTVIVDEAHALSAFSQLQLRRLLAWLGALGCPVVLLSATLPASTCNDLVRSYLSGAGHRPSDLNNRSLAPAYPGWMFADAREARTLHMDDTARQAHLKAQRRPVRITLQDVTYRRLEQAGRTPVAGERLTAVADALAPVIDDGGCAAVVCATVADAQDTYAFLRQLGGWAPGELLLVHARRGDGLRERLLLRLRHRLGRYGPRPTRLVVITTSLLDTSLDIDVDLMVSDLASLARLLQRAGRLGRFTHHQPGLTRPAWWDPEAGPKLTVLHPVNSHGATALPPGWHRVEPAAVLHATAHLLTRGDLHNVTLPDDVQHLVEAVHGTDSPFAQETARLQRLTARHTTRVLAEEHHSAVHLVPAPQRVSSLADLHRQHLTAAQAATRLGTLPRRLLPCYRTPTGRLTLDPEGRHPLPDQPHLNPRQIRTILEHSLPVPAAWVAGPHRGPAAPDSWQRHALLADTVLLPTETGQPDVDHRFGQYLLRMDPDLGLIHRKDQH